MQVILDHLGAVLIASSLILLMAQVQLTGQQSLVDTTRYYASRTQMTSFIEVMQRDFQNLGAAVSPGEDIIEDYVWDDDEKYLTFRTVVDTTAGATAKPVQYKLVPSRTVTIEENGEATSVQCYEVQRLVFDGMIWEADGKSPDSVVEFEIELLDNRGDPLGADLSKTRQILVRVAAISPMGQDEVIRKTRWQTTFHPINLALLDN